MNNRIFENDLYLPALYLISINDGNINTQNYQDYSEKY
mgnify:CR=1 FL=1